MAWKCVECGHNMEFSAKKCKPFQIYATCRTCGRDYKSMVSVGDMASRTEQIVR